jgi:hypothetical protein
MSAWSKLTGTQVGKFILGLTGVTLKNNAGNLEVRNNADTAFASVKASEAILFNDTAGFGNTIRTQATQAANVTYDLPLTDGSPGQVLATDGAGLLDWISASSTASSWKVDTTTIAFGSGSTVSMFTLPANAVIENVIVIVDTAFDGTANLSVGISGNASKYFGSSDASLQVADRYEMPNQLDAVGSTEALEVAYSAGGATVGTARVLVSYAIPS